MSDREKKLEEIIKRHIIRKMTPATCMESIKVFETPEEYRDVIETVFRSELVEDRG